MKIGFIVNKDFTELNIGDDLITESMPSVEVSIVGPIGCDLSHEELLKGHPFRMFDDDGNLYYTGFLVGDKESEEGFLPLDCYGTGNAGCTYIEYKNDKNEWVVL